MNLWLCLLSIGLPVLLLPARANAAAACKTAHLSIRIGDTDAAESLYDSAHDREYLATGRNAPLLSLWAGGQIEPPASMAVSKDGRLLTFTYARSGVTVKVQAKAARAYLAFEILSLEPSGKAQAAVWGPYPTIIQETVGVVRDGRFAQGGGHQRFQHPGPLLLAYQYPDELGRAVVCGLPRQPARTPAEKPGIFSPQPHARYDGLVHTVRLYRLPAGDRPGRYRMASGPVRWFRRRVRPHRQPGGPKKECRHPAILKAIREWESARHAGAFSDELKADLRDTKKEFHLERPGAGEWKLTPIACTEAYRHEKRMLQPGQPTASRWGPENPYGAQPL
ncbi:MAG: hypothetical protein IT210_00540 [Armatimonadetes bacterium]|nr:hypothetical protein [Armatimonadota bacterium]